MVEDIFSVSASPFTLKISAWDARFPPVHSRRILCFKLPDGTTHDTVRSTLTQALRSTVQELPFLAGTAVPPLGTGVRHWQRTVEPAGNAFIRFSDVSGSLPSYGNLASKGFPQAVFKQDILCPFPAILQANVDRVPVCGLQANFVEGGLLLVFSVVNIVGDGRGISDMIDVFAKHARNARAGIAVTNEGWARTKAFYEDRRQHLSGFGTPGSISRHTAWTAEKLNAHEGLANIPTRRRNIRVSAESLKALKATVSPKDGGWISTHDALAALLWRTIMVARHEVGIIKDAAAPTALATAVDCRRHLALPKPYYGVAIYAVRADMPLNLFLSSSVGEEGLRAAAKLIRSKINQVTGDDMADLVGFVERTGDKEHTRLSVLQDMPTTGILLVSHWRFTSQGLDFGPALGPVQAVRHPDAGLRPGMPTLLPMAADGSAEIMLNEREDVMDAMMRDEMLMKFASAL